MDNNYSSALDILCSKRNISDRVIVKLETLCGCTKYLGDIDVQVASREFTIPIIGDKPVKMDCSDVPMYMPIEHRVFEYSRIENDAFLGCRVYVMREKRSRIEKGCGNCLYITPKMHENKFKCSKRSKVLEHVYVDITDSCVGWKKSCS